MKNEAHARIKINKLLVQSRLLMVAGRLQREGDIIHVIAQRCYDLSKLLKGLTPSQEQDLPLLTLSRGDEKSLPPEAQKEVFSRSRNFK